MLEQIVKINPDDIESFDVLKGCNAFGNNLTGLDVDVPVNVPVTVPVTTNLQG